MTEAVNNINLDKRILVEQIRILYRLLLPIVAINLLASAALLYGLWNIASRPAMIVWLNLMLIVATLSIAISIFFRYNFRPEYAFRYALYFIFVSTAAGLVWGIGGAVLFPAKALEYQLFILCALVGMGAGSVSSLTTYLPAYYSYLLTSLLPISIKMVFLDQPIHLSLGIMTLIYIIALSYFGYIINRAMKLSLKLHFENADLIEQLRKQKEAAEKANIDKSKLLAAASHDLRQPLYALSLFTSALDEFIQFPKVRRVVDQINASVGALQSMFNALLDISQLDAGVMKVEKSDFFLQPMFKKLANDFDLLASQKNLRIIWPSCVYAVNSDQILLEQILRNYISNAIRYTNSGDIRIRCEADDGSIHIHVTDTGIGIPYEKIQEIFEEFHQLSNVEHDRSKGLGLGLAIAKRTATLLEHPINVVSQPGKGSTFSIEVNQVIVAESPEFEFPESRNFDSQTSRTLMVVIDDESSIREGTQSLFEQWDCEVITAKDRDDAILQLRQQNRFPDGIVADYHLSQHQTGVEAIQAIFAELDTVIPALIVTGDITVGSLREAKSGGFQVLNKPVSAAKLRTFLRHVQLRAQRN